MANPAHVEQAEPNRSAVTITPDTITPSQYFSPPGAGADLQPEKRLVLSVLETAVADYQRFAPTGDHAGTQAFHQAAAWFASTDRSWPFAFENACDWLGFDAGVVRRGLTQWRETHLADASLQVKMSPFRRVVGTRHKTTGRAPGLSHLRAAG